MVDYLYKSETIVLHRDNRRIVLHDQQKSIYTWNNKWV